ncbi:MAG: hypothetical protein A2374_01865 [Candidatus Moranbacteria bacterium RIFOXYB1_FULL_44_23]|nr:MAG: hypothetical protein A2374_01865 [Candidatus Moranbacteria bacterium RIFOXYB1_FULL_44_23]OGI42322.1 MAG: hypothetical protein A2593_04435 [Candidatus Moranbacteria bacterium RIFOXYD1_FULL_44_9]HBB37011.1 hypothetical protein [Candidatus Moranbacteria bacterium]HBU24976.1 hypothetical protein [Candidatus Moranbacteria bacterium]
MCFRTLASALFAKMEIIATTAKASKKNDFLAIFFLRIFYLSLAKRSIFFPVLPGIDFINTGASADAFALLYRLFEANTLRRAMFSLDSIVKELSPVSKGWFFQSSFEKINFRQQIR